MRILECPYCFSRVGVLDDGICPQCRKNVDDRSGIDPRKDGLIVSVSAKLPELCCLCASPSTRRTEVRVTQAEEAAQEPASPAGGLFRLLGKIPHLIFQVFQRQGAWHHQKLTLSIPRCDLCAGKEILPITTHFDAGTIKLVVHPIFKEEYLKLNGPA